jgi:type II secretory pathway component GspD/PulD (secretin)
LKGKGVSFTYDKSGKVVLLKGRSDIIEKVEKVLKKASSYKINVRVFVGEILWKKTAESGLNWERVLGEYNSQYSGGRSVSFSVENGILTFKLRLSHFNLEGLIGILTKYARVKVVQNVLISVGNGMKGSVVVGEKVPYVKEIGTGVIGQNNTVQTVQTVNFGEVNSGIKIVARPFYDEKRGVVRLNLIINDSSVSGYVNLKSGQYEVTRPIVREKSLETRLSFSPNEVIILSSLNKESASENGNSLEGHFPYKEREEEKKTTFVVVGVEVVKYECSQ